jgi:hypothetical protein
MSQPDLVNDMPPIQFEQIISSSLAVLIAVPAIKLQSTTERHQTTRPHIRVRRPATRQARRRLRREVRFAGYVLLGLVPIGSAFTLGSSSRPDRILACSISDPLQTTMGSNGLVDSPLLRFDDQKVQAAVVSPSAVALTGESTLNIPGAVAEAPVIFPGYVLPDDSRGDSLHEGS